MRENYIEEISETGIKINICKSYNADEVSDIIKNVNEATKRLPEKILNHLIKNEFEIEVVSKEFIVNEVYSGFNNMSLKNKKKENKKNKNDTRNGCYIWGKRCIYVILVNDMNKVILHEIGHFLDYKGKMNIDYKDFKKFRWNDRLNIKHFRESYNSEFLKIYKAERGKYNRKDVFEEHYRKKYSEHFAESFSRYIRTDKKFIQEFEKSKSYIKKFIDLFEPHIIE
ncbi:MAG: hypothetical protein E6300_16860 [Clostridium sp.]|uniref:anthrax toxin lethal factor-related metalloendopeptidase n=1 Tax=Clostridium sp. TaxID=1506 RepID=UPI0029070499|nr:hypothetical protein [Clostridium sp.]MDU7150148.1 hypothetical protein [Clostridium sp.]MDU7243351.1 hypothetical protein [Clostridium sp.]